MKTGDIVKFVLGEERPDGTWELRPFVETNIVWRPIDLNEDLGRGEGPREWNLCPKGQA